MYLIKSVMSFNLSNVRQFRILNRTFKMMFLLDSPILDRIPILDLILISFNKV